MEKNNEFFYQSTIYLVFFDMDVFFQRDAIKELVKYTRGHSG